MKLAEWIRERKKMREAKKAEKLVPPHGEENEEPRPLEVIDTARTPEDAKERRPLNDFKDSQTLEETDPDIEPAPSRFTDEYQAFLKRLDAEREGIRREVEEIGRREDEEK